MTMMKKFQSAPVIPALHSFFNEPAVRNSIKSISDIKINYVNLQMLIITGTDEEILTKQEELLRSGAILNKPKLRE